MHTLSAKEWDHFYRANWREPFAHLSKPERGILVRGCRGKAIFESVEEAQKMLRVMQPTGKLCLAAYRCLLCRHFHVTVRRHLGIYRRYSLPNQTGEMGDTHVTAAEVEPVNIRFASVAGPDNPPRSLRERSTILANQNKI